MLAVLAALAAYWEPPLYYVPGVKPIPKGTPILYNVYLERIAAGGVCEYSKFWPIAENFKFTSYTLPVKLAAGNYCAMVTAIVNGVESSYSNVANFSVP